ncbi:hypothetical protein LEP1GSC199_0602 [Leptospira vanthielii serovar Holland str. Waz Holland = ATCC 700522]|uniref:Uncharacterized protein n=2 Tax=Leptospira vanthielii TaxID=293085 RepID=N1W8W9_9LEPT|nr:hypothetical protein LEP1GSC199_0602 [Leptospira vanthielii serovar Holland str. Waz Holland = ATCC 700522]
MKNDDEILYGDEYTPDFFDEDPRIFYTLIYALSRAGEEELLSKLEVLGEKLENDEELYLPEFKELITEIILKLRTKYSTTDIFTKNYPNPDVEKLMLRFEILHLIDQIDEEEESKYLKDAADFLKLASNDFHTAIEKWDATLTTWEDLIVAHIIGENEDLEEDADINNT